MQKAGELFDIGGEPEPIETLIFLGVGETTAEGVKAVSKYRNLIDDLHNQPEEALRTVLAEAHYFSGPIADIKKEL